MKVKKNEAKVKNAEKDKFDGNLGLGITFTFADVRKKFKSANIEKKSRTSAVFTFLFSAEETVFSSFASALIMLHLVKLINSQPMHFNHELMS